MVACVMNYILKKKQHIFLVENRLELCNLLGFLGTPQVRMLKCDGEFRYFTRCNMDGYVLANLSFYLTDPSAGQLR